MTEEQSEQLAEQRERIKDDVVQSIIKRYTIEETQQYIRVKHGRDLLPHDYNRIRGELKRDLGTNLRHLKRDRYAYRREYFKRIDEIRLIQRNLWKLIDNNEIRPELQMDSLSELNQTTVTLANLYDSIRKLDKEDVLEENDEGSEEKSEPMEESLKMVSSSPAEIHDTTSPAEIHDTTSPAEIHDTTSSPEIHDTTSAVEFQPPPKRIQKYTSDGKPVFA